MKKVIFAVILCCASIAFAQAAADHRYIDFTQVLTDLDGTPIPAQADGKNSEPLTLGMAAKTALVTQMEGDPTSGADKLDRYELAKKVQKGKHVELTTDEITMIKNRIMKGYAPVVVGAALPLLDPATKK